MNLCNDNHEEVCYETKECPVCKKMDLMQEEYVDLHNRFDDLFSKNEELEEYNDVLKDKIISLEQDYKALMQRKAK
jgi:predicted metal-binding transcription factor (methanogenesis marker protein 9)